MAVILREKKYLWNMDEFNNLSSIIKIGFRPLRNNELLITLLKMYRDTLRKGYEVNRCLSAENLIALHKNQFSIVVSSWFSPLNLQVNSLTNRFLWQSEFRFYYRTQVNKLEKESHLRIKNNNSIHCKTVLKKTWIAIKDLNGLKFN